MTFWHELSTLLHDPAHWAFELLLMALFDGVIGAVAYPALKRHWQHHLDRDRRERENLQEQHFPEDRYTGPPGKLMKLKRLPPAQ